MASAELKQELLVILNEECSEVQKCISKFLRFGEESTYLVHTPIEAEVADVLVALNLLLASGVLNEDLIESYSQKKYKKLTTAETTNLVNVQELLSILEEAEEY